MQTTAIVVKPQATAELAILETQRQDFAMGSRADNTKRAYTGNWRTFCDWCAERGVASLPTSPDTLSLYITDRAGSAKVATLQQALSSIAKAHKMAGHEDPRNEAVRSVWEGIRRAKGIAPTRKAAAVTDEIKLLVAATPDTLKGTRDRALILIGVAGAFRRSELVALDLADVDFAPEGARVTIRRSKTDQEGAGDTIGIPYGTNPETCPVRSLMAWLKAAKIEEGALFRRINRHGHLGERLTAQSVALVVKELAAAAGLAASRYAGHSLRAGLATSAAAAGVSLDVLMSQTRHKSTTVAMGYIRRANIFTRNAAASVGL